MPGLLFEFGGRAIAQGEVESLPFDKFFDMAAQVFQVVALVGVNFLPLQSKLIDLRLAAGSMGQPLMYSIYRHAVAKKWKSCLVRLQQRRT